MLSENKNARASKAADGGLGGLFAELARDSSRLVRQEIALAKAELAERVGQVGAGAGALIAGAVLLFAACQALLAAAVLGLALLLQPWLAALTVGGVVAVLGLILMLVGRRRIGARNLVPQRTLRTLLADAEWARGQMR